MRNLEERKEEIFRRSEARIAQRKKTVRRVVMTCVPLVLCVSIASGWLLLEGFGKSAGAPETMTNGGVNYGMVADSVQGLMPNSPESMPESPQLAPGDPVALEIGYSGTSRRYTDAATLSAFLQMIGQVWEESSDRAPETTGSEGTCGFVDGEKINREDPYPVAVTYADGTVVWYTLRGNQLTQAEGNTQVQLTDEQAAWLHGLRRGE